MAYLAGRSRMGGHWVTGLLRGLAGVARGQLRQALGMPPRHPTTVVA